MTEKAQTLLKFIWAKGWPLPLGLALVSTLALWLLTPQASSQVHFESPPLDNLVPKGFVLVPIEVENKEALDSLVGAFGMVDLYAPEKEGPSWRQIGSRMKLARSETGFMSLLVPEQDALKLLAEEGPFRVAVLNPVETKGATALHHSPSSRITYQDK